MTRIRSGVRGLTGSERYSRHLSPACPRRFFPAAAGGNKKGGGRNEQKVNQDRKQSAGDKLKDLKKERDQLKSKQNKTPKDKADLQKTERAINREIDRQKKSENHSKKDKGAQR
ncbi:MAG: hypothetical protein JWM08_2492 [Candidatus Angelobacter sp.]|nr:hypothetical protein [Candidatus Angelobacter sp.]